LQIVFKRVIHVFISKIIYLSVSVVKIYKLSFQPWALLCFFEASKLSLRATATAGHTRNGCVVWKIEIKLHKTCCPPHNKHNQFYWHYVGRYFLCTYSSVSVPIKKFFDFHSTKVVAINFRIKFVTPLLG
jgi:hypothetical protein